MTSEGEGEDPSDMLKQQSQLISSLLPSLSKYEKNYWISERCIAFAD